MKTTINSNGASFPLLSKPADVLGRQPGSAGHLAHSVMHDMNNALMIASSYCELLMDPQAPAERRHRCAAKAHEAVVKAADLVKQMRIAVRALGLSQSQSPERLDLDKFMSELLPALMGATDGESLKFQPWTGGAQVVIDRVQLGQLLAQAISMACDGQNCRPVEVHTGLLHAQGAHAFSPLPCQAGDYVWISIACGETPMTNSGEATPPNSPDSAFADLDTISVAIRECGGEVAIDRGNNGASIVFYLPCLSQEQEAWDATPTRQQDHNDGNVHTAQITG